MVAQDRGAALIAAPPAGTAAPAEATEAAELEPGPPAAPGGAGLGIARRRVLFVQSGCVESAARALARLAEHEPAAAITYLTHDAAILPADALPPGRTEVLVARRDRRFFRDLYRRVATGRYDRVAVLFTGEPGYRRFKLFALGLCWRPVLAFDRDGESFDLGPRGIARRLLRRLAGRARPAGGAPVPPPPEPLAIEPGPRLELPRAERPAVSIVLAAGADPGVALESVRAIAGGSTGGDYEVILAGAAANAALSRIDGARAARVPPDAGVGAAWNAGAALARGERLLFLAGGAVPAPDCLAALASALDAAPGCGAAGARVLDAAGRLLEAGGIVWRDGTTRAVGAGEDPEAPAFSYRRETDYCSSAALMVRRRAFERLGGFDPRFTAAAAAAADLCFGLRSLGLTAVTEPRAEVTLPAGGGSESGVEDLRRVEAARLRRRHRRALRRQLAADPDRLFVAADRRRDRILLVIDHYVPMHDRDAGSFVMYQVLMTLRRLGYRVIFWPDNLYRLPDYTEGLQAAGIEVIYGPVSFEEFFAGCSRFLDGILIHRAPIASKFLERIGPDAPELLYISADLEHLREQRRTALDGASQSPEVRVLLDRELAILGRVARAAVHSPLERDYLARTLPGKPIGVLPLPVRPGGLEGLDFERRHDLLFVGSTHPPNVDAVDWYAERLAPRIAARLPGVRLTVVGESSKPLAERWAREGAPANGLVRLAGYVPDLGETYRSARVFVAPLRYGAGVKGKILEAMSHGVPVVTTSVGAEGIPIVAGRDALVADGEEEFAAAVAELYGCRDTWESVRTSARRLIEEHYSDARFETALRELVEGPSPGLRARK